MFIFPKLQAGDYVEIIAPASRCSPAHMKQLQELLTSWQLHCIADEKTFGDDLLCANSDAMRSQLLQTALQREQTKAIFCARGGYGSMRLIPQLSAMPIAPSFKLLIGMSDITALHLYMQKHWQWSTLHASCALEQLSVESIARMKTLLFGEVNGIRLSGRAMNPSAEKMHPITAKIIGGNLSIVQCSLGTLWQIDSEKKIIFLEEINERAYRVDRMLEHLRQAKVFAYAAAIIFGDFIGGNEPNGSSLIFPILERFAKETSIPVVHIPGVGHSAINSPLPLGVSAELRLEAGEVKLIV